MHCHKTSFAAGFQALTKLMSLLRADSVKKVVRRRESETHLAKPLKFHNSSTPCLTECLKCFPSVAQVSVTGYLYYLIWRNAIIRLCIKVGHRGACVGTWDLGTRDEGLEDIKYGARGRVGRGSGDVKYRDAECESLSQKLEVNTISLSS